MFHVHPRRLVGGTAVAGRQQRRTQALSHRTFLDERDAKRVHPGLGRETNLERVICR